MLFGISVLDIALGTKNAEWGDRMAMTEFKLYAETENEEYSYLVVVEESSRGLARLNVSCVAEGQNEHDAESSQGVDLNADECEALGQHLLTVARRLFREQQTEP